VSSQISRVAHREWTRVLVYALLLAVLTTAPYVLGWAAQGSDKVFSGFFYGTDDGSSYLGKMRLGAQGRWDFFLFYTAEEHDSAGLLFLPYIIPGQIARLFTSDTDPRLTGTLLAIFHLMRVVFGVLLIAVIYRFIAAFLRPQRARFLAMILATLGGGFGWLLIPFGSLPPEFYIPEGFTFQILFGLPHLALARAALLTGLLLVIDSRISRAALAGFCWLVVGLAVPFYLVIIYAIVGAWGLAAWIRNRAFPMRLFICCLVAGGITLPLFFYNVLVFTGNPAFAQWSAQNLLPSPLVAHYFLAYLPLGALALIGGRWAWQRAKIDIRYTLLIGWPLIVPIMVYIPINVQRRMAEAVIIPLSILAAAGVMLLAKYARKSYRKSWRRNSAFALLATLPVTLFLLLGGFLTALGGQRPTFHPTAEIAALNWLNEQAVAGEVVLGAFETGNIVPAYTNLRVYVGHGPETLHAVPKTRETERFFSGEMTEDERAALYEQMRVRYVFYGHAERELAGESAESPEWVDDLTVIYSEGDYIIYEVGALHPNVGN
jgi:hypothetical protein